MPDWRPVAAVRRLARETPERRDRHVDLLRAVAICAVVAGHWLAIHVTYTAERGIVGASVLAYAEWTHIYTWLFQVMPVFFLVGGFANAAAISSYYDRGGNAVGWVLGRTDRLLRPTTALILVITVASIAASVAGVPRRLLGQAAWLLSIPLWFLVAYIGIVFLTPIMWRLHRRAGIAVPVALVALTAVGDLVGRWGGFPVAAQANFLFVWLAVHQTGFCWRDGRLPPRTGVGVALLAGGAVALVLFTVFGPYPVSMVAVPGEELPNTSPPSLALVALAIAQTGVALSLRRAGNRWLRRERPWMAVIAVNAVIMTVFLWHMAAAAIGIAVLVPTGIFPEPLAGSAEWLLWRLPWLACLALILAVLVAIFGRIEQRRPASRDPAEAGAGPGAAVLTVVAATVLMAGLLGITVAGREYYGPAGLPTAAVALYLAGAAVLRFVRLRAWAR